MNFIFSYQGTYVENDLGKCKYSLFLHHRPCMTSTERATDIDRQKYVCSLLQLSNMFFSFDWREREKKERNWVNECGY